MDDELEQIARIPGSVIFLNFLLTVFAELYLKYEINHIPQIILVTVKE